ncbi:MAG: GNAT family N-acetyltransferase [Maritimibacter sp.]|nr:GNAT family N-acetyltransferase [Maritimibacter sp.]
MTPQTAYPWELPPSGTPALFAATLRGALPRLETARLVLRAPEICDFAIYRDIMMSDRALHMGGPLDRRAAWLDFTQVVATWCLRGHGLFAIEAKDTGETLGFTLIGFEHGDREPEFGWFLTEAAEGKGYAYEAAKAVRDWGLDTLGLTALVSYIDPPNTRSVRLAERLGGWLDPVASAVVSADQGEEVVVYRHWPPADSDGGMEAYA